MKAFYLTALIAAALSIMPIVGCAGSDGSDTDWQKLWEIGDKNTNSAEGQVYNRKWLDVQNKYWPAIAKKCMPQLKKERIDLLRAVLIIDETGRLTEFLPAQESDGARCYQKEMIGKQYPRPPKSPFYMALGIRSH